ncbi:MATE family efflux transporter [Parvicella tangerina]|uniref:Multidrug-efflux transporter n=1 Tax=Parvicella tangerina TaxID=2829795 RepID=A0A916JMP8_9FLAO|nr:MATE family efflux transporter [Parvicella tangerina]CAG5080748.1 DNA damage-inducible protein F [Parvicella tangerina]
MPSLKEINKLALPAILYNIAEPLLGLVDTAVIGQMSGDTVAAQGGIGLAAGLISTLIWGLAQIRTAVSSLVSQYLGKDQLDKIKTLVPQSLYFSVLVGIVFWAITAPFFLSIADVVFLTESDDILNYADDYYQVRAFGLPLSLLIAGFFGVFRGYQNTSFAMYTALIGGVVNIVLDIILVNGWLFIPPMGVEGVALASVISQFIMVLICLYFLQTKTPFEARLTFPIHFEFKNMLLISGNMLIRTVALNLAFILALRFVSDYGENVIAAYSIGIQIWLFSSYFIDGYSNAGNALSGKLLGSGDKVALKKLVNRLLKINLMVAVFLALCYSLVYNVIGLWFNDSLAVNDHLRSFFWMIIIAQPLNSIAFTMDGIYKGMGKAKLLRNTLIIATFGLFIPVLYFSDYLELGVYSVWIAFISWMAFRGGSLWMRLGRYT